MKDAKPQIIKVDNLDKIRERETVVLNITHIEKVYQFKIWNLTGPEIDQIGKEKSLRAAEMLVKRPMPPKKVSQGEDEYIWDAPQYRKEKAIYDEEYTRKIDAWWEYMTIILGLYKCNGWEEPKGTEEEKMLQVRTKLGLFWGVIIREIDKISTVKPFDIEDF